jgi:Methyltransferase domain
MRCPICDGALRPVFTAEVLHKYSAEYEHCGNCGFLRAREPHWLEEAYSSAIAAADTGLVMRNLSLASKVAAILYGVLGERGEGRYLDAAGGYGMLTRLMRDLGFDFYWADKYCENLLARGFDYDASLGSCQAVTAMEVMEHLTDPIAFVDEVLRSAKSETLLFSTELYAGDPPRPEDWWYYTFPTGQHIGFFQRRTLEILGQRLGLQLVSAHGLHALSRQPLDRRRFALATNPYLSRVAAPWIRHRVGSRTLDDHHRMMSKR